MLKQSKADGLIRITDSVCEIIIGDRFESILLKNPDSTNSGGEGNFLLPMVAKDVKKWVTHFGDCIPQIPKCKVHQQNDNYDFENGTIVGIDINHAYWRVAYNFGYIGKKTYLKGLESEEYKLNRNKALSILGRVKVYKKLVKGVISNETVSNDPDPRLKQVYESIRLKCYWMMNEMAEMLGDDFESYNTDCIYFRNTEWNTYRVIKFLEDEQMEYKVLTHVGEL